MGTVAPLSALTEVPPYETVTCSPEMSALSAWLLPMVTFSRELPYSMVISLLADDGMNVTSDGFP